MATTGVGARNALLIIAPLNPITIISTLTQPIAIYLFNPMSAIGKFQTARYGTFCIAVCPRPVTRSREPDTGGAYVTVPGVTPTELHRMKKSSHNSTSVGGYNDVNASLLSRHCAELL